VNGAGVAASFDAVEGHPLIRCSKSKEIGDRQEVAGEEVVLGKAVPIVDLHLHHVRGIEASRSKLQGLIWNTRHRARSHHLQSERSFMKEKEGYPTEGRGFS